MEEFIDDVFLSELKASEQRMKARKPDVEARLRGSLKAILLDLYAAYCANPERYIRVSLGKAFYAKSNRYDNRLLSYQTVLDVVTFLRDAGYVDFIKGFYDIRSKTKRSTAIRGTGKLLMKLERQGVMQEMITTSPDMELVRMKDSEKHLSEYDDNGETTNIRDKLNRINAHILSCDIHLNIPQDTLQDMRERRLKSQRELKIKHGIRKVNDGLPDIDFTRTVLRRVFNNDSFNEGGRFYGGWWISLPKRMRKHILIDGEETVELDYRSLHPRMLYNLEGIDPPHGNDAYQLSGFDREHRDIIKVTFQRLLNAKQRKGMVLEEMDAMSLPVDKTFENMIDALLDKHKPIAHYFFTGYGIRLQRLDSDIAEAVMLDLMDKNVVALPVHDSFIVPSSQEHLLLEAMVNAYEDKMGYEPEIDH